MNLEHTLPLTDAKDLSPLHQTSLHSARWPVGGVWTAWVKAQKGKLLGLILPVTILLVWELVTRFGLVWPCRVEKM